VSYHYGFLVESMVSILLLLTILYCVRLNKQLRLLKADEQSLRATISELVTATDIAERAIAGLKATMREGEQTLSERLARGEELSTEIEQQLKSGDELLGRLARIAMAGRVIAEPAPDAKAVAAAAQAFAERTRSRLATSGNLAA
jgi:chromosome segregation ATPase